MKLIRLWLPALLVFCGVASSLFAQDDDGGNRNLQDRTPYLEELDERDFVALREFLKARRQKLEAEGLKGEVTLTGDVRFEWSHLTEKQGGKDIRGRPVNHSLRDYGRPISCNDFDVQLSLVFSFETKHTWMAAEVRMDNDAGVGKRDKRCRVDCEGYRGSGECNDICLRTAYAGYNIYEGPCGRVDIEFGRRNLYYIFDSEIQFGSRSDGILLYMERTLANHQQLYWQLLGFVVDERVNHFAWATEFGALDIGGKGVDFKYSFIHWNKYGRNACGTQNPLGFQFKNSQFLLAYNFDPKVIGRRLKLYGAFLVNHDASRRRNPDFRGKHKDKKDCPCARRGQGGKIRPGIPEFENGPGCCDEKFCRTSKHKRLPRQNLGWYLGFLLGQVRQAGDWSLQVEYEAVQAFCMPDKDQQGIGRGNVLDDSITGCRARGNTNFTGWWFESLYALTDELIINTTLQFSKQYTRKIGGRHSFSCFKIETLYSF